MITWRRGRRPLRACGYCVPPRLIAEGEWYAVFALGLVRCFWCATTRMGFAPPVELEAAEGEAAAPAQEPLDWKQRAAGDG